MAKRKRNYADERAKRDDKYRTLGYANYNAYDRERRQKLKLWESVGADRKTFAAREKVRREQIIPNKRKAEAIAQSVVDHYARAGNDMTGVEEPLSDWWSMFRLMYSQGIIAA